MVVYYFVRGKRLLLKQCGWNSNIHTVAVGAEKLLLSQLVRRGSYCHW